MEVPPKWMVLMEIPLKWMIWGYHPHFRKPPYNYYSEALARDSVNCCSLHASNPSKSSYHHGATGWMQIAFGLWEDLLLHLLLHHHFWRHDHHLRHGGPTSVRWLHGGTFSRRSKWSDRLVQGDGSDVWRIGQPFSHLSLPVGPLHDILVSLVSLGPSQFPQLRPHDSGGLVTWNNKWEPLRFWKRLLSSWHGWIINASPSPTLCRNLWVPQNKSLTLWHRWDIYGYINWAVLEPAGPHNVPALREAKKIHGNRVSSSQWTSTGATFTWLLPQIPEIHVSIYNIYVKVDMRALSCFQGHHIAEKDLTWSNLTWREFTIVIVCVADSIVDCFIWPKQPLLYRWWFGHWHIETPKWRTAYPVSYCNIQWFSQILDPSEAISSRQSIANFSWLTSS